MGQNCSAGLLLASSNTHRRDSSRIIVLEEALERERRRGKEKGADIDELTKLLASLEATVEQQATVCQLDQLNLSKLEGALAQSDGPESENQIAILERTIEVEARRAELAEVSVLDLKSRLKNLQAQLADMENERVASEALLEARDAELKQLSEQVQVAEKKWHNVTKRINEQDVERRKLEGRMKNEVEKRIQLQGAIIKKQIELRYSALDKTKSAKEEVLGACREKDMQASALQKELAEELSKRQELQSEVIEKERLICKLQENLAQLSQYDIEAHTKMHQTFPQAAPSDPMHRSAKTMMLPSTGSHLSLGYSPTSSYTPSMTPCSTPSQSSRGAIFRKDAYSGLVQSTFMHLSTTVGNSLSVPVSSPSRPDANSPRHFAWNAVARVDALQQQIYR